MYGMGKSNEDKLRSSGYLTDNYEKEKVNQIGEPFQFSRSVRTCGFENACPEVALFDNGMVFNFIPKKAITSGFWDELFKENQFEEDNKFQIHKTGHYTECPEFSQYHYENKIGKLTRSTSKRRIPISQKLRFEIFQRDKFTCQYCKRNRDNDGVKLHIDHIIPLSEGGKDEISNLITSCEDCNQGKSNKII